MQVPRQVFFVAGFDPKSPRYYHRIFRTLAQQHPAHADPQAGRWQVGARQTLDATADAWDIRWQPAPGSSASPQACRLTLLRWDDIVREHWAQGPADVARDLWRFHLTGWRHGVLGATWRHSRVNWAMLVYPLAVALVCAGLALALAWAALALAGSAWPVPDLPAKVSWLLLALATPPLAWALWRRLAHAIGADWLLRLFGFAHAQATGDIPRLEARVDAMAERIRAACEPGQTPSDVLVVGHSVGGTLAASALARALAGQAPGAAPPVDLLTLGHCTPLVYFNLAAHRLRAELDRLSAEPALTWVDYTAPADWAGCGRMPPWHRPGQATLCRLSPRFHAILSPARYQALRRNRLALHMQYLMPAERTGGYDLLDLLASPRGLRARHSPPPRHLCP